MSRGSTFTLTMECPTVVEKNIIKDLIEEYTKEDEFTHKKREAPPFMYNIKGHYYVEKDTSKILSLIAAWSFCSSFTVMWDWYNMDLYGKNSIRELSLSDLQKWKQAVTYMVQGKYSPQVEELLDNPFVEALKNKGYDIFHRKPREDEDVERWDLLNLNKILNCCYEIFGNDLADTYNEHDKRTYRLLYSVWG